ncbi:MAG TPA: DUF1801 domain-containing protein [Coriobacteriia bacterium]|nr:DUF1801 domain-containing protein [Coriobacteriia bacterium]
MSTIRLERFLEDVEPQLAPVVTALHESIMAAKPDLDVQISLKMLMYGVNGDFRHWVCSIGTASDAATLRFLPGAYMRDPELILKPGTGGIRVIEFPVGTQVDTDLVRAYAAEAVVQLGAYRQR